MIARMELAALDNNHNLDRKQATTSSGSLRYRVAFPKGRKEWVAKPIMKEKHYTYIKDMMMKVVQARLGDIAITPYSVLF